VAAARLGFGAGLKPCSSPKDQGEDKNVDKGKGKSKSKSKIRGVLRYAQDDKQKKAKEEG